MPFLVLYTDGQLIVRQDDNTYEKYLSPEEMDGFLARIKNSGFFNVEGDGSLDVFDPIYEFPEDAQYSDGAGSYYVFASDGTESKQVSIYSRYTEYLIPDLLKAYDIISNYYPNGMEPYRPQQLVLWVELGNGEDFYEVTPEPVTEWPGDLPPIRTLGIGHIVVDEKLIPRIISLFDKLPSGQVFKENDAMYIIIIRPLLPNESPSAQW